MIGNAAALPNEAEQPANQQQRTSLAQQEEQLATELEAECNEALAAIEHHIYSKEGDYLEKTAHGNISRGWEGFLDTRTGSNQKRRFDDKDRLFSYSSWTFCSANPQMFVNTRDDDPDNWCLALRKRPHATSMASILNTSLSSGTIAQASGVHAGERPRKKRKA